MTNSPWNVSALIACVDWHKSCFKIGMLSHIVLRRDKCGLENVSPKHSLKAIAFCYGEEQTTFTEPLSQFPGCRRGSTHVRAVLPHPSPTEQISSSLQGQGRRPIAPGGVPWHWSQGSFPKEVGNWRVVKTDKGSTDLGSLWG